MNKETEVSREWKKRVKEAFRVQDKLERERALEDDPTPARYEDDYMAPLPSSERFP